jgi:hypothetical protein
MGERSAAAAHDRGLSGHVNHVAGRGIGIGARLAMGVIAVAAVTQAGATSAPDADAILQRAFDNYRAGSSATSVAMTVRRPDWERHLDLKAWTRGQDDALVRFVAPAKDARNATLKLGRDTWVFNPKLNQVIKLPASMMSQSWMGSDFSYNDLAKSNDIITLGPLRSSTAHGLPPARSRASDACIRCGLTSSVSPAAR